MDRADDRTRIGNRAEDGQPGYRNDVFSLGYFLALKSLAAFALTSGIRGLWLDPCSHIDIGLLAYRLAALAAYTEPRRVCVLLLQW